MRNCCEVSKGNRLAKARASLSKAGRGGKVPSLIALTVLRTALTRETNIFIADRWAVKWSATVILKNIIFKFKKHNIIKLNLLLF